MKSPKKRTKQDGGMSLWSRLRFAIDFDDDETIPPAVVVSTGTVTPITPITAVPFDTNLRQAISNTIAYYGSSSSSNFKDWYDRKTSLNGFKQMKANISSTSTTPSQELAKDIVNQLVSIDTSLVSYRINIETLVMSLFVINDIASALFTTSKQPITAMESVLITQLCNDKLKNAINNDPTIGITVADGHGKKPTTRKSRGRKSRSPNRR